MPDRTTTYAEGTTVPVERSKAELDRLLGKHGATQRLMGTDESVGVAAVGFSLAGRRIRLRVPIPTLVECRPIGNAERDWHRWTSSMKDAWRAKRREQIERERWRALVLIVKAKLELVQLGLTTVEREFLADLTLPNGQTVHEMIAGDIERAYTDGGMPPLLGAGAG